MFSLYCNRRVINMTLGRSIPNKLTVGTYNFQRNTSKEKNHKSESGHCLGMKPNLVPQIASLQKWNFKFQNRLGN